MNEKNYKKRLDFQQKVIAKKTEEIESLNAEIVRLKLQIEEKDNVISSVASLREELSKNVAEVKKGKEEYKKLIEELKKMKDIMNQTVFKGRWRIIRLLMK